MNGLDLFRSPKTAADEIADIVSAQCPPVVPENCDAFSCRECWLALKHLGEENAKLYKAIMENNVGMFE